MQNISRESLIKFYKDIIYTGWDYKDVKSASDKDVLTKFTDPNGDYITFHFLKSLVFGESIFSKIKRYSLQFDHKNKPQIKEDDKETMQLYEHYVRFFNPDVIYTIFDQFVEDNTSNLFVLERDSLTNEQKSELIQRCESWIRVHRDLQEEMSALLTKEDGPIKFAMPKTLEYLIAKTDPNIDRDFIHQGKVLGFEEVYPYFGKVFREFKGMEVDGFEHPKSDISSIILIDAYSPERFSYLAGQTVKFHFRGIFSIDQADELTNIKFGYAIPFGKLVDIPNTINQPK